MRSFGQIASSAFIRPLDYIEGAAFAWSLWQLRSAYTGYAFEARRSSDNATTNVSFDKGVVTNNSLVSAGGTFGVWRDADVIYVRTLYDQTVNGCNMVQTTLATQPIYTDNHYLGRPAFQSLGNSYLRGTSTILKSINSYSQYFRLNTTSGASGSNSVLEGGDTFLSGLFTTASNVARFLYRSPYFNSGGDNVQTVGGSIPSGTYFGHMCVRDGTAATQTVWVNNSTTANISSLGQPAWPATDMIMTMLANGGSLGSGSLLGYVFAGIGFPFALTAQQRAFLQASI